MLLFWPETPFPEVSHGCLCLIIQGCTERSPSKRGFSSPQVTFIMVSLSFSVVLDPFICLLVYLYVYDLARSLPHS